jgi:hypothetical protein
MHRRRLLSKRGRPRLEATKRKEVQVSVRLRRATVEALEYSASIKKGSLAREITERIEDSLAPTPKQPELFGGRKNYSFALLLGLSLKELRQRTGHWWHEDPFTFQHAKMAANFLFNYCKPPGRSSVPKDLPKELPGTVRRIKSSKPREALFGAAAAAELVAAMEAFMGEYGKQYRQVVKRLPARQQEIYLANADIYERLGRSLLPLKRKRPKK